MKRITLKDYDSSAFPVIACWKTGSCDHSSVFANVGEAEVYLIGRFGKVSIADKTGGNKK